MLESQKTAQKEKANQRQHIFYICYLERTSLLPVCYFLQALQL